MPSTMYLEAVLEKARAYLPDWLWKQIHQIAMSSAGGKSRWASDQPSLFEKLALTEMRPSKLKNESDDEIRMAWLRLNQWYSNAKRRGAPIEDIVNTAVWVMEEMDRRGFKYKGPLVEETRSLKSDIPSEILVIPDFVSIVGSSVDKDDPNDLDILVRAEIDDKYFKVRLENIWLPLRKVFDPQKKGRLHLIDNPSGPHANYIPCYSLVLRKEIGRKQIVKELVRLDLGCGKRKPKGYIGIDKDPESNADIIYDLEIGIPYSDNSVDEVRAYHILEHLDPMHIMPEIHRVLKPGGRLVFEVPSTDGHGAFAHPEHKSFWNTDSIAFWTKDELLDGRPKFEVEELEEIENGNLVYVRGVLKKPYTVEKYFDPPKPTMAFYTEFYTVDELWDNWAKDRMPVAVEPKLNGFRAIWERNKLWFEGEKEDVSKKLGIELPDLILDCDVAIERDGRRLPRNELNVLNSDNPLEQIDGEIVVTAFDVIWDGEDLKDKPFSERRERLEALSKKYGFEITPMKVAHDKKELEEAAKWAFNFDRSEGLVAKTLDGKYEYHSTDEWAKIKRVIELKVVVLKIARTKSGQYNYNGGVLKDTDEFTNIVELNGKEYIDLGQTFNTSIKASVGDVITCQVHELIPSDGKLSWLGATVLDIDKARKAPYTAKQAIDVAKRGQVLQKSETPEDIVEVAYVESMEKFGEPVDKHTISEVVKGKLYRVNDGWGERYYLVERDKAKYVAVKMPDVLAFHADGPPIDKAWVKEHGWSNDVWDRALTDWVSKTLGEEGETRSDAATEFWSKHWYEMYPSSGKGRFVYHHHWRGLSEEETNLSDEELLGTDHSVHGDLRFEADDALWGFSVFLGTAAENKAGDRLINLPQDDNLQGTFKLAQPKAWLDVGIKEPYISEPGGVGATSKKYSKFFAIDHGTYEIGVWREHLFEVFIHGKKLKGRFLIEYAPVGGKRIWIIDKPKDQTPYAEQKDLEDVIAELKQKGQKYLIWSKPGEKPKKIDVEKYEVKKHLYDQKTHGRLEKPDGAELFKTVPIAKIDEEKRIVYGVALDPYQVDAQDDWIPPKEIEETAHRWMEKSRVIGYRHYTKADAIPVESYLFPYPSQEDWENAMEGKPHKAFEMKFGNEVIHSGAWVIGTKILSDDLWKQVKDGEITAYSIGGVGARTEIKRPDIKVEFVKIGGGGNGK